ncbi:hypothetical protein BDW59DRAFT_71665 [Aspergillus cavernicola]|uniref:Uncharacterized protein n=1 Tax=Aspergillus cavernicola TaxID=176166 RepID=A0ABR4IDC1_9EURO
MVNGLEPGEDGGEESLFPESWAQSDLLPPLWSLIHDFCFSFRSCDRLTRLVFGVQETSNNHPSATVVHPNHLCQHGLPRFIFLLESQVKYQSHPVQNAQHGREMICQGGQPETITCRGYQTITASAILGSAPGCVFSHFGSMETTTPKPGEGNPYLRASNLF